MRWTRTKARCRWCGCVGFGVIGAIVVVIVAVIVVIVEGLQRDVRNTHLCLAQCVTRGVYNTTVMPHGHVLGLVHSCSAS